MLSLGMFTGYGSARVLAVVGRRGRWLAVLSDHMPNSRRGWIPRDAVTLLHEPYTLHADLSERELVVRHERRVVRRIRVAVGLSATPTPTGRFAVTDVLRITGPRGPYGCCALALTGLERQRPAGDPRHDEGGDDRQPRQLRLPARARPRHALAAGPRPRRRPAADTGMTARVRSAPTGH